jgi:hypothetical protein
MDSKILRAALDLAALGLPSFSCLADKRPATPHGFKDATADPSRLQSLWSQHPGELVGVPTGSGSGFDVLDLDAKHAEAKAWWKENCRRFPQTRKHRTRSGGLHLLFKHDDAMRCSAGKIALGVDTRSDGGYVVWWPAAGLPVISDAPPAPWPAWFLAAFRPKPQLARRTPNITALRGDGWLRGLVRLVANAGEGQRNGVLFWASCRAGEAVGDGKAGKDFVIDVLIEAAAHAGLPQSEARRTIQSGMRRA